MNLRLVLLSTLALLATPAAFASTIDLTFEGIASPGNLNPQIGNYYNGGAGPNYGIAFPTNALAICLNTAAQVCSNTSRGGLGDPNSQGGGLFFLSGGSTFLTDPAGFTTGFSLNYAAINTPGSIDVYSGIDGTGSILATLSLAVTPTGACNTTISRGAAFCPFVPVGATFAGTAHSIVFNGAANQIVFDDVTFGSATPGGPVVPEPSTLLLVFSGIGALATQARRRFNRA